jgi:hypothetical protein
MKNGFPSVISFRWDARPRASDPTIAVTRSWTSASVQSPHREARYDRFAPKIDEYFGQRMRAAQLTLPICTDDAQRGTLLGAYEMPQHEQRRLIGPMQVVENQQQWSARSRGAEKCANGFEQAVPMGVHAHRRRRKIWSPVQESWYQLTQLRTATRRRQLRAQVDLGRHTYVPGERFDKRLIRDEPFFVAAADEHGRTLFNAPARERQRQLRLADTRLAGQQYQLTMT